MFCDLVWQAHCVVLKYKYILAELQSRNEENDQFPDNNLKILKSSELTTSITGSSKK